MSVQDAKVIDWTVYALDKFAGECYRKGDIAEAALIDHTIQLYEDGFISVKWEGGQPVYSLTPEAKIIMDVMEDTQESGAVRALKDALGDINERE